MSVNKPIRLKCPHCGKVDRTKVLDVRPKGPTNRRKRECLKCHETFTTIEEVVT